MTGQFDPELHQRRSLRLKGYDYSRVGAYFVTICTHERACLFGGVSGAQMQMNGAGQTVAGVWHSLTARFPGIGLDVFVVMPNHVHGIIVLTNDAAPTTLADVVGAFKSLTTVAFVHGVKTAGWPPFPGKLWQRNYYEHIIRHEDALHRIRQYIVDNPARWAEDPENPVGAPLVGARFQGVPPIDRATTRVAPTKPCDDEVDV